MNKIAMLFICFILIISVIPFSFASENVTVNGVTFEIPDQYTNGRSTDNSYLYNNIFTFAIRALDSTEFLVDTYGDEASNEDGSTTDLTIGNHDVVHIVNYVSVAESRVSYAFFACGDVIYCISWKGSEMTPEIEDMIRNSPDSNYTYNEFHDVLNQAETQYQEDLAAEEQAYDDYQEQEQNRLLREIEDNTRYHHFYYPYYWHY